MAISLTVGNFRSSSISVTNADGSANNSAVLSVSAGNPATLRVRVNPSNPREVGVLGLDVSSGVNANVSVSLPGGTKTVQTLFTVNAAPNNQEALGVGAFSDPETDPPAWML